MNSMQAMEPSFGEIGWAYRDIVPGTEREF
jgi:hypothetical protein